VSNHKLQKTFWTESATAHRLGVPSLQEALRRGAQAPSIPTNFLTQLKKTQDLISIDREGKESAQNGVDRLSSKGKDKSGSIAPFL
jgi:hypothetical protein